MKLGRGIIVKTTGIKQAKTDPEFNEKRNIDESEMMGLKFS
jgi:hypothetical protein